MGAISLHRGNLHRVPHDVPRRWLMPTPRISLKAFRHLILRRKKSLSLLPSSSAPPPKQREETAVSEVQTDDVEMLEVGVENGRQSQPLDQNLALAVKEKEVVAPPDPNAQIPALQGNDTLEVSDEKEKRKREVEEKLHVLNEKKHSLVQALKQILNAEEELKRLGSLQANQSPLPLQVDASADSGSMTRHATPRSGTEGNGVVDVETGEGDDASKHNPQAGQLLCMSSTSPSAESALRRPPLFQHNATSRAATVAAGSPSRFAPTGNQGQSSNLPTVLVTDTNYATSSPSPAASGGTSVFRDGHHPSPRK